MRLESRMNFLPEELRREMHSRQKLEQEHYHKERETAYEGGRPVGGAKGMGRWGVGSLRCPTLSKHFLKNG